LILKKIAILGQPPRTEQHPQADAQIQIRVVLSKSAKVAGIVSYFNIFVLSDRAKTA